MKHMLRALLVAALLLPVGLAGAQEEPVTIEFWHTYNEVSPEHEMLIETLIPMFEEMHPNIKVVSVPFPYGEFRQALLTALAGGEGPELARLDIIWSPEFAELGVLATLDEVMPDFEALADAVFPGPLSTNFYDGHYYGLPLDTNTRVWMWGATVYEEVGLEAPPETIDEVAAQCEAVKALGEEFYVFGDDNTTGWNLLPWIWTFGGDITDPDITMASGYLNSAQSVAALEFLAEMVQSGCFSPAMIGTASDPSAGYFTDQIASILNGPWMYPIAEAQYPDFEIQTTLMPAGEGGSISVVGGENIVMFSTTPYPEEAMEFLRFTQSDEYQLKMSETGQLTVLPRLLETEYYQTHPYYGIFLQQLETARARTPHPKWTQMEEVLTDAGQLILRGEMAAQEALDIAAEEIDALLAE
ncbi:MAG: extracellular solute-binding protein [Anaerolineae bacterium]|nr:extracellular solute-binding protein [Anaerolineae bacterium]